MSHFSTYRATQQLKELAKDRFDLRAKGALTAKRLDQMQAHAPGIALLYGTEQVDTGVLDMLEQLAQESCALEQMCQMQEGAPINHVHDQTTPPQSVLHTAQRAFLGQTPQSALAKGVMEKAYAQLETLKIFLESIDKEGIAHLIQIGIGGSELGPQAAYQALRAYKKPGRQVHFLSNFDPDATTDLFNRIDLSKSLIVVVSKSGATLETATHEAWVRQELLELGLSPANYIVAVTTEGSPMDDPTRYRQIFYMDRSVGGRFSVTSMAGGVALAFAIGMEKFLDFLKGAALLDQQAREQSLNTNLSLLSALLSIWNRNFLGFPTTAVIPYTSALARFPAHLQQCEMESNGKQIDRQGSLVDFKTAPVVWGEPGTNAQHAFYQALHQGTDIVPVEFIGFCESQHQADYLYQETTSHEKLLANLFAQSLGLALGEEGTHPNRTFPGNRPSRIVLLKKCDPHHLGQLFAYFEHKIVFEGFIWGINSFDQEGVELGKRLASQLVEQFAQRRQGHEERNVNPLFSSYLKAWEQLL